MRNSTLLVAAASLLLAAMPVQAQDVGIQNPNQATPTTLYFHVINVQDMPINTQMPDDKFVDTSHWGLNSATLTCVNDVVGDNPVTPGMLSPIWHTMYGYSSPSYVEYDFQTNGQPRTHPERGISYDGVIATDQPFTLHWYLASFYGATGTDQANPNSLPAPIPNVVVAAAMKTGDAISIDDKGYDGGETIAAGATDPALLMPGVGAQSMANPTVGHDQVTYIPPQDPATGKHVWHFAIPMTIEKDILPRATGFNVRIDVYMDNPQCAAEDKSYIMPNMVEGYTAPDARPNMQFSIMNPIRLEYVHPGFVGDDMVIHTSMNSVWGNYDVGEVSALTPEVTDDYIKIGITGPSPATSLAKAALVQRFHEHYHHQEAVDVTYVWPYKTDRAENGMYTVTVEFMNDAGNAKASGTAQFEIGKGTVIGCGGVQESAQRLNDDCAASVQKDGASRAEESPGLPLVGLLGALGAAAAVALRRRQA